MDVAAAAEEQARSALSVLDSEPAEALPDLLKELIDCLTAHAPASSTASAAAAIDDHNAQRRMRGA